MLAKNTMEIERNDIDIWYQNLRDKIETDPESYPHFQVEGNCIFKRIPLKLPLRSNISERKLVVFFKRGFNYSLVVSDWMTKF